ncbi:MAG TPA: sulfite exporter TauE/SafE family protein [Candidatus Aminicenantes bacterium]|nr:sulfite exporter TauE/SafE family protein [Candidatus Aminicenantes bacterium]HRY63831.1 sulfite exporter TauE/SafE family protein [Candidatus Aminicenantes bacterium]HRZ70744.1 sulfite exporter TauE/SafE family protein [Candidatus Aminicenantes bacterium]
MTGPWLIAIGIVAGVFAGLFGIGGGIIIVPALILFAGFPLVRATGTSLAAILLPVGILGVIAYYKARIIDLRASLYIAAGLLASVIAGAWLANALPVDVMRKFFAVFCFYVGWNFVDPVGRFRKWRGLSVAAGPEPESDPHPSPFPLVGIGLLAGIMAGMFGIGGGNIIVPLLTLALRYPPKRAIATSLGAILFPFGIPGVLYYAKAGNLDLGAAAWIAAGLFLGTVFGALITIKLPGRTVKLLYGLFLLFVACRFFFS